MSVNAADVKLILRSNLRIIGVIQFLPFFVLYLFFSSSISISNLSLDHNVGSKIYLLILMLIDLILVIYTLILVLNFTQLTRDNIIAVTVFALLSFILRLILVEEFVEVIEKIADGENLVVKSILIIFTIIYLGSIVLMLATVAFYILNPKDLSSGKESILVGLSTISILFTILTIFVIIFPLFAALLFIFSRKNKGKL